MEFFETYKDDIKAFIEALIEFFKTVIAKLFPEEKEEAAE